MLESRKGNANIYMEATDASVKAMFIADTHLLGPKEGHWFDKLRRFVFY